MPSKSESVLPTTPFLIRIRPGEEILDELEEVLGREKFQRRIAVLATTVEALMNRARLMNGVAHGYQRLSKTVLGAER